MATNIDGIHVWLAHLDGQDGRAAACSQLLSPDERLRADRFRFDRDRRRFVVCRGLLRTVLGRELRRPPEDIEFTYGPYGKPAVAADDLTFNVSHSDDYALFAVGRGGQMGVDIEHIREVPDLDRLAESAFSAAERATFATLPSSERVAAFYNGWTRKEAYIKARGEGLTRPLDAFDVTLAPGERARLVRVLDEPAEPARWSIWSLTPVEGYAAAICVEGHDACEGLRVEEIWPWSAII
jgi:4'-phosphopantetheinyl transferase